MTIRFRFIVYALGIATGIVGAAGAQQSGTRIELSRLGPQVGQVVPDFKLQDARGKVWTRDAILGSKGAMLVFSRSADW
ncbi:MAG: hypothetical protein ABR606_13820 [Vicinamibacterales bacterium]